MGIGVLDKKLTLDELLRDDVDYSRPPGGGEDLFDLVGPLKDRRVLDIGCGLGPYRSKIESRGGTWIGIDLAGPGCSVEGDGMRLPFANESFDGVLCAAVLEHLPEPELFLREVARIIRPGGKLFGYVSFLEPFHGISYFHMTHMGIEYLFLKTGFHPERIFAPHLGVPFQLEQILFTKPIPVLQPMARVLLRAGVAGCLRLNRFARDLLVRTRGVSQEERRRQARQYHQLIELRHAVGHNFIARRSEEAAIDSGYRTMVQEG